MPAIKSILHQFDVDYDRGFLPPKDPLGQLPPEYGAWDELARDFTAYINAGVIRDRINQLPLIDSPAFTNQAELERAMLLLSFFAHAYVHFSPKHNHLPPSLAIPWVKVAQALKRKPILSHSSVVLNNWRKLDPAGPIRTDNLATLCQFHGGLDESWFYLITVEIEQVGAKAIPLVLQAITAIETDDFAQASRCLEQTNLVLVDLHDALKKMYEHCAPTTFYHRVRPYLASFEQINYQGTGLEPQSHHGGSAAQSSLLQFFDAAFGIEYPNPSTADYLKLMRHHMPFQHAAFLAYVETKTTLPLAAAKDQRLALEYKKAIKQLTEFRNEHLKIVALYIIKQAKLDQSSSIGTGGTNPMVFLKSIRNQTQQAGQQIDPKAHGNS
ncbi:MAG: hypothetical protein AAF985_16290 [Bacteroidota bacterium]